MLDEDDYLWAQLHGFPFSERFGEYLKMTRREVEIVAYGLVLKRVGPSGQDKEK
jgi:hypothetical protein